MGKSSIINGFLGRLAFASAHLPVGVTDTLQEAVAPQGTFLDTPGLNDAKKRKAAAEAISQALQKEGEHRLFFVIALEGGRVNPQDKVVMKLVIDACKAVKGFRYSIIVNKLSPVARRKHLSDEKHKNLFYAELFEGIDLPMDNIYYALRDDKIDGQDNMLFNIHADLRKFIAEAPSVIIPQTRAKKINDSVDEFQVTMG